MNIEERKINFLEKVKKVHQDKYDYSLVDYKNSNTKVKIICPKHGIFEQQPSDHRNGRGCSKCSKPPKYNTVSIINEFKKIHPNSGYDYSLVDFLRMDSKVQIICPKHGIFQQTPNQHIRGKGCYKCKNLTKDEIIEQFQKVHQDKYDYSLVDYKNSNTKVKIICPKHGIFEQRPSDHKRKAGCPICSKEYQKINPNGLKTEVETIEQFKKVHQDKYNYSLVKYINTNTKVKIICPIHGDFEQTPANHKNGDGCPKCSHTTPLSKEELIERFNFVHKNKYDYSIFEYKNAHDKVKIICSDHGTFEQSSDNHRTGSGCPKCKTNKAEEFLIDLFKEYNINYLYRDLNLIKPLEIDILVPDFNFGIEHNGLAWHSFGKSDWKALDNYYILDKNKHLNKTLKVEEQGYQLFHIREDHLLNPLKKEIWKSILLNKCGISTKVHARKLQVVNLNNYQDFIKQFLEENHLQGNCPSSIKLGLQDPKTGVIYSIMTFGKSRFDKNIEYELLRFCNLKYHNVRGAASKLMSAFEKYYKPNSIVSYANRDWSQGNLYKAIGFNYSHISEPNYIYTNYKLEIIKRQQVQKHKLKKFLESRNLIFNEKLSERDNMICNGYRIYYDTGNLVYHKKY